MSLIGVLFLLYIWKKRISQYVELAYNNIVTSGSLSYINNE